MDTALLGVLLGFALAIIYKAVDLLTLRREEQRQAEEHARSRAELDARWQEIEERHRRIAALLENLPTARRKRELREAMDKAVAEERFEEAIAAGKELLGLESDPEWRIYLLLQMGAAKYALGRYEDALTNYNQSLALTPNDPVILAVRGAALERLGRYNEALEDFDRALQQEPDNTLALPGRGTTFIGMGRYEDAVADLNRFLELRPDHPVALRNRAAALYHLGRYEEALIDFDRALELRPRDPDILDGRGLARAYLGQYEKALDDLYTSLNLRPNHPGALNNLGLALWGLGQLDKALQVFNLALVLFEAAGDQEKGEMVRHNLELFQRREWGVPMEEAFQPILIPSRLEPVVAGIVPPNR